MISNWVWIGPKGKHFPQVESYIPQFLLDEKEEVMDQMIRRGEHEAPPTKTIVYRNDLIEEEWDNCLEWYSWFQLTSPLASAEEIFPC